MPTEVKADERRVAITPDGVRELEAHGVEVLVQAGAGARRQHPRRRLPGRRRRDRRDAAEALGPGRPGVQGEGAPGRRSSRYLRDDLVLFTYLHLAAYPAVADALCAAGTTGVAYETVQRRRRLPAAARADERGRRPHGGAGRRPLPRGAPGRPRRAARRRARRAAGRVVVIGAGNVGWNSAWIAAGMEAEVNLLDKNLDRLRFVDQIHKGRITTLASNRGTLERCVAEADLVIGAVLVPGGRAPVVVTEAMVRVDEARRGDRRRRHRPGRLRREHHGRPATTTRSTSATASCTTPSATSPARCPRTSTHALTNATLPYLVELAVHGVDEACRRDPVLAHGLNTGGGEVVNPVVAEGLAEARAAAGS